jgi:hypothetical protein
LPGEDLVSDLVGDLAERLLAELRADGAGQVVVDVAQGHAAGVEADDHLLEAAHAALTLGRQPRRERALTVTGDVQEHAPDFTGAPLIAAAVPGVREQARGRVTPLLPQVAGQFRLQATLQDGLDQPRQQAASAGELHPPSIDLLEQRIERAGGGQIRGGNASRGDQLDSEWNVNGSSLPVGFGGRFRHRD